MKSALLYIAAAAAPLAAAFPNVPDALAQEAREAAIESRQQKGGFPEPTPPFDAKKQYVSISGKHKFLPPDYKKGDLRGPCPGLNAMANHNYIPRSGAGGHLQFIYGTQEAFGMGRDLSGFLTVLGATLDGNGLKWSIGGPSKHVSALLPALGMPQGISGSHNRYETDVSPGRGDLYKYGNDFSLQLNQFQALYDMAIANGDHISLELLSDFRSKRFDDSIQTNPYFFNGPFAGVFVQPAAYTFIYRFMSNKSAEHPQGYLDTKTLMSFFGVFKDKKTGKLSKKDGWERFPEHWFKRHPLDPYDIALLEADTLVAAEKYPKFLSIGGNTGKVDTFTAVDPGDIMAGAGDPANLLKKNNLACFALEFAVQAAPDMIRCSNAISHVERTISTLNKELGKTVANLQCPQLGAPDTTQFSKFPGYAKLNCKTGEYGPVS